MTRLRLGSRSSALAMWQARHIAAALSALPDAPQVEIIEIKTSGDAQLDTPLWKTAGKGFFTAELDRALLDNAIDLAVHSLKDLPTKMVPGLALAAVPEREDSRDALVCRAGVDPDALPDGATIGTSSLRRRAFVARWHRGFKHAELRGNVPTRVQKLDNGQYDAIVLAVAGLKRLGLGNRITRALPIADFTPAVSQGALGIATREDDSAARRIIAQLEHLPTRLAVNAERTLLNRLEGGCQIPLGANARIAGNEMVLTAQVCTVDGSVHIAVEERGDASQPELLGEKVATLLIERGARDVLAASPRQAAEG